MRVVPFEVHVPDAELDELRRRVRATRWPDAETVAGGAQGVPLDVMHDLARYWADGYSWRRLERRLAGFEQYRAEIDGLHVHFVHVRSPRPDATPLIVTHGWPGSFLEFLDVVEPLTQPPDDAPAFHVVVPSLPGYGFSDRPRVPGWGIGRIARAWATLMAGLGYDRYGAAGGDWGTSISTLLGLQDRAHVVGLHLTPPLVAPDLTSPHLTEAERADLAAREAGAEGSAYSAVHASRPQTLGYGLSDSPTGLAAWIFEKVAAWSDHDGDPFAVLSRDQVLDDVTLYWLTGTATSSTRLYAESIRTVERWMTTPPRPDEVVRVPVGAAIFRDNPRPSRRWAERRFADLRYWGTPERGGHFPAWEQPQVYVRELRATFRAVLGR
ncbi:epoxide hydrolase family protein [Luteimicrobium sp. NPDC057192]|uniref:epoxide hydrolase family protein n=1 Tax=Luteimicrobium sp. NPDC057192 TaxID=3346042 RepID=UPI00363FFFC8